jgi:hypothetical protein
MSLSLSSSSGRRQTRLLERLAAQEHLLAVGNELNRRPSRIHGDQAAEFFVALPALRVSAGVATLP